MQAAATIVGRPLRFVGEGVGTVIVAVGDDESCLLDDEEVGDC